MISIRGHSPVQRLPSNLASSWPVWTFENGRLFKVEDHLDEQGWVNPTSFDNLYFPSDLPLPDAQPGLGIVVASGTPRYIMPTVVLSLKTPDKKWRNRGLCSLPRAKAWIDLFAEYSPAINRLRLHGYGLSTSELRFLEDQDGGGSWENLISKDNKNKNKSSLLYSDEYLDEGVEVTPIFDTFKLFLESSRDAQPLSYGYHFVDIPLKNTYLSKIPKNRMKLYLTDFEEPKRLINYESAEDLDLEPLGELAMDISVISAGASSEFLPDVYVELFEPGSIIIE